MKFEWTEKLSTGVELIDSQHKELIKKINDLLDAMKEGKGRTEINNTVQFLTDYVITHFKTEEDIMIKYNYPEYNAHKKLHDNFIKDFSELIKEMGNLAFTIKLQARVCDWLIEHINGTDKVLGNFLKEKIK